MFTCGARINASNCLIIYFFPLDYYRGLMIGANSYALNIDSYIQLSKKLNVTRPDHSVTPIKLLAPVKILDACYYFNFQSG